MCAPYASALADVRLPHVFSDHMVLQRDIAAPVWGWAMPGEGVTVRFGDQQVETKADAKGKWAVKLQPEQANARGQTLEVAGDNKLAFKDVLVGDVWICSGQSNMEFGVGGVTNSRAEIAKAQHPGIRLFDVPGHTTAPLPQRDNPGAWRVCSPQTVGGFSAVGYFFGRRLHKESGVPIGLIGTNWGGTRIEPWIAPIGFRGVPELKSTAAQVDRFDPSTSAGKATWQGYVNEVEAWVAKARESLQNDDTLPPQPAMPGFTNSGQPTAIYNAMVAPLAPYGVRGAIWYQGESNGNEGEAYFHKMQALINGWRQVWQETEFPMYFYFVQLANFQKPNDNPAGGDGWARLRKAQRHALSIDHTGMAVITDIGEANDIHPRDKQDVGQRLALWALRDVYDKSVVVSGPLFKEMTVENGRARLTFDHVGGGLMVGEKHGLEPTREVSNGKLQRFAIAGKDRKWQWAEAKIDGDAVVVWSEKVPQPAAVRYAYSMNPEGANLYNKEGLPASPFRTDSW